MTELTTGMAQQHGTQQVLSEDIPFGRSRFMAAVASGVIGLAGRLIAPDVAEAWHGNPPFGCYGYGVCHCCSGCTCCSGGCYNPGYVGCVSGVQCWYVCVNHFLYECCDWCNTAVDQCCICRCQRGVC
jgi:hypothetical protein